MKRMIIVLVTVIAFMGSILYLPTYSEESGQTMMAPNNMGSMMKMCQSMMNSVPQDVIIKAVSGQIAKVDEEFKITLLVIDKNTDKPLDNANVILHIEEGVPMASMGKMTMMDMMDRMFEAENIGSGKYLVKFTPTEKGYYTMHTHVILPGKSMMYMMNNHMDIGIIAN